MATQVYEVEEITLEDGSTVTIKPAVIKVNRKGQELMQKMGNVDTEEEGTRQFLDLVYLALKRQRPDFTTDEIGEDGEPTGRKVANYDLMEDLIDYPTMFRIIHVCFGVNFADPKLLEVAAEMAAAMEKDQEEAPGQN